MSGNRRTVSVLRPLSIVVSALIAATVALSGCSGCNKLLGKADDAGVEAGARPPVAWDAVQKHIGEDGKITKEGALMAFSLHFGALPGVTDVPKRDASVGGCATLPILYIAEHWKSLTDAQRAAVKRALAPKDGGAGAPNPTRNSITYANEYAELRTSSLLRDAQDMENALSTFLNRRLPRPITLDYEQLDGADPAGEAWATAGMPITDRLFENDTPYMDRTCVVTVTQTMAPLSPLDRRAILAHEIFHCFQFANAAYNDAASARIRGGAASGDAVWGPMAWLIEGGARWAGATAAAGPDPFYAKDWREYLRPPANPSDRFNVFQFAYQNAALFDVLATNGVDIWGRLARTLGAASTDTFWTQFYAGNEALVLDWTSGAVRKPSWGGGWDLRGRFLPAADAPGRIPSAIEVVRGQPQQFGAGGGTQRILAVTFHQPEVEVGVVEVSGTGRMTFDGGGSTVTWSAPRVVSFCFKAEGCRCPNGQPVPNNPLPGRRDLPLTIAMFGVRDGGSHLVLKGRSLAEECDPQPDTPDAGGTVAGFDRCLVGTWNLDTNDARSRYQQKTGPSGVNIQDISGGQRLVITAGGSPTFQHSMLPMNVSATGPNGVQMVITFTGDSRGTIRSGGSSSGSGSSCDSRGTVTFTRTSSSIQSTSKVKVMGQQSVMNQTPLDGAQLGGAARYQVQGNRLTMTPTESGGITSVYTR